MEQFYFNIYILRKQYSQKWNIIDKKKRNRLNHRKLQIQRRIKHYEYIEYIIFLETINYMKRIEKFQKKKKKSFLMMSNIQIFHGARILKIQI